MEKENNLPIWQMDIKYPELEKLTKEELKKLASDLLYWQEVQYKSLEGKEDSPKRVDEVQSSFWELAGAFQSIRKRFKIRNLF